MFFRNENNAWNSDSDSEQEYPTQENWNDDAWNINYNENDACSTLPSLPVMEQAAAISMQITADTDIDKLEDLPRLATNLEDKLQIIEYAMDALSFRQEQLEDNDDFSNFNILCQKVGVANRQVFWTHTKNAIVSAVENKKDINSKVENKKEDHIGLSPSNENNRNN